MPGYGNRSKSGSAGGAGGGASGVSSAGEKQLENEFYSLMNVGIDRSSDGKSRYYLFLKDADKGKWLSTEKMNKLKTHFDTLSAAQKYGREYVSKWRAANFVEYFGKRPIKAMSSKELSATMRKVGVRGEQRASLLKEIASW